VDWPDTLIAAFPPQRQAPMQILPVVMVTQSKFELHDASKDAALMSIHCGGTEPELPPEDVLE
jgi:hypothetical protein